MATQNMFQLSDIVLIDAHDYDPTLHQKPLAWEDLKPGEFVEVAVIGFVPVVIKAKAGVAIFPLHSLGAQANAEVDVIVDSAYTVTGGNCRIVFKKG